MFLTWNLLEILYPLQKFQSTIKFKMFSLSIEEVANEILNTDKFIKEYTQRFKNMEVDRNNNHEDSIKNLDENLVHFKSLMNLLEEKTEYLFKLKKQYNILYKKINNLN